MKYTILAVVLAAIPTSYWLFTQNQNDSSAPTDADTVATTTSKYDNINVKTIERREHTGRSLMSVAYPVTENIAINQALEIASNQFISEFEQIAAEQEELYQDYLAETGTVANSAVANFIQHFDVSFANDTYVAITFDRYQSTGGTGQSTIFTKIYNRATGDEIPLRDLFTDESYLQKLSDMARTILIKRVESTARSLDGTPTAIAEFIERNTNLIKAGTE